LTPPPASFDTDAPDVGPTTLPIAASIGLVAVGGAFGAGSRYELGLLAPAGAHGFPWATLLINVSGALALGALLTLLIGRWSSHPFARYGRPLLTTGFIGAYTTWSTYMDEITVLTKNGSAGIALGYLAASLAAGLVAAGIGVNLAGRWR
jgi:CrcB protein